MNTIKKEMLIKDILCANPYSGEALMECGMGCIGCPASQAESLEQACAVHGLDADDVVDYVNHYIEERPSGFAYQ